MVGRVSTGGITVLLASTKGVRTERLVSQSPETKRDGTRHSSKGITHFFRDPTGLWEGTGSELDRSTIAVQPRDEARFNAWTHMIEMHF